MAQWHAGFSSNESCEGEDELHTVLYSDSDFLVNENTDSE